MESLTTIKFSRSQKHKRIGQRHGRVKVYH
uniref:Uncharacterized protein n=1 Tax=Arundo donax TaxID=35708 RepID=A0A0A9FXL9_ARUDO